MANAPVPASSAAGLAAAAVAAQAESRPGTADTVETVESEEDDDEPHMGVGLDDEDEDLDAAGDQDGANERKDLEAQTSGMSLLQRLDFVIGRQPGGSPKAGASAGDGEGGAQAGGRASTLNNVLLLAGRMAKLRHMVHGVVAGLRERMKLRAIARAEGKDPYKEVPPPRREDALATMLKGAVAQSNAS